MDIKGNSLGTPANVTSLLARVAVAKNQEIRELISKPAPEQEAQKTGKAENSSKKTVVTPTDAPSKQADPQTTGRLVNVNV